MKLNTFWVSICCAAAGWAAGGGCATRVVPPANPAKPVAVYVADYGRHSSVLLPTGDGGLLEYAYGDYDWFAANKNQWGDAVRALFWSRQATLGRRRLDPPPHPAPADLAEKLSAKRVVEFAAARERVNALVMELEERYEAHVATIVYNPSVSLSLVEDDEHYGIAHNCNHLTARWLKELGCDVKGIVLTSHFELAQAKPPTTRPAKPGPGAP